jgi:hypothetical protein
MVSSRALDSPMMAWLSSALANTEKDWIIAYWHHPPYSFAGHHSDFEAPSIEMRQYAGPILENYGADLVLCGHNHDYERSFLIDGHYGYSWELQPEMILDNSLGRDPAPYRKPAGGIGSHCGTIYTVCGCSGQGGEGDDGVARHPVTALTRGGFGSMVIEVDGLRLTARFLRPDASVDDQFTIDKSMNATNQPLMTITRSTNGAILSWPTSKPAFALQSTLAVPATNWEHVAEPVKTNGRQNVVTVPASSGQRFFRLHNP